jgi:uncharacterized protein with FMN-binding domain
MRRITLWLVATVALVVLLFSYRTSTSGPGTVTAAAGAQRPGIVAGSSPSASSGAPPSGKPPSSSGSTTVVNGIVAQTRWGPLQVRITLSGRRITDVTAIIYPSGNGHDQSINAYALPQLRQQVLSAQSAHIDGVSGATVTSDGYRQSLQAALDAAHVG